MAGEAGAPASLAFAAGVLYGTANTGFGRVEEFMGQGQPVDAGRVAAALSGRSVVLVGMMGAGKTSVGKRLAAKLGLPFVDADAEIEAGAQLTISEIFERFGELYFREGERKVIARLLNGGPLVLATGGGAFMNATTRQNIAKYGVSIWLKPSFDILLARVRKKSNRPLLKTADPEQTLRRLLEERTPTYALADFTIESLDASHDTVVDAILRRLDAALGIGNDRCVEVGEAFLVMSPVDVVLIHLCMQLTQQVAFAILARMGLLECGSEPPILPIPGEVGQSHFELHADKV